MKPMLKNSFFSLVNDLLARGITPELKVSALTSYGNLKWEDGDTTRVADLYSVRDCSPLTASTFRKRFIKWFDEIIAAYHAAAAENLTEGQKVLDGDTVRTVTAFRKTVLRDSNGLPINQECPRSGVILLDGKYEVMAGSVKPYTQDNINLSQQILENPRSLFAVANNVVRAAIIETAYAEALEENDMFDGIIRDGLTPQQRAIQTRREGNRTKQKLKLTEAQIFTLRRMMTGTKYQLRGDAKKAIENRPSIEAKRGQWFHSIDPVNAPSVPVLYRLGLVDFTINHGQEPTKYYNVRLTDKGQKALMPENAMTKAPEQRDPRSLNAMKEAVPATSQIQMRVTPDRKNVTLTRPGPKE